MISAAGKDIAVLRNVMAADLSRSDFVEAIGYEDIYPIDDPLFGGWAKAQPYHFGDGGIFDQIYKPASSN